MADEHVEKFRAFLEGRLGAFLPGQIPKESPQEQDAPVLDPGTGESLDGYLASVTRLKDDLHVVLGRFMGRLGQPRLAHGVIGTAGDVKNR